jgi:hypothetical protein
MAMRTRLGAVLLALVLAALLLALVGPMAKPAKSQVVAPPTLDGESLEAQTSNGDPSLPDEPGDVTVTPDTCSEALDAETISYVASGPATGPYPGTFTESGTFTIGDGGAITSFTATFDIDSTIGEVTGTKSAPNLSGTVTCFNLLGAESLQWNAPQGQTSYEATIVTPSSGTVIDRGKTDVHVETIKGLGAEGPGGLFENADVAIFSETFFSDLARVLPTTKAQCKNGGYEQLGYNNQGECVKAVQKLAR